MAKKKQQQSVDMTYTTAGTKDPHVIELEEQVERLTKQLRQLETTRSDQVEELLAKQSEMMGDIAELLTRCIK